MAHELPFRTYSLKKHDQLQFEEDDGVNRGTTTTRIGLPARTRAQTRGQAFAQDVDRSDRAGQSLLGRY